MTRVLPALLLMLLLGACAGSSEVAGDRRIVGTTSITFTIKPARVEAGKSVRLTLRLANAGRDVELAFASSQRYDFWVTQGKQEIWRWSDDQLFTQQISEQTIRSQSSLVLDESWAPSEAGTYTVHGEVYAEEFRHDLTGELVVDG